MLRLGSDTKPPFHLLLRTGKVPISTVMRRLLKGYVVSYNRRHRRYGNQPPRAKARSLVCYWAVIELEMSGTSVGKQLGVGQSTVSRAVVRGKNWLRI